jgi:hypothetical protein
MLRSKAWLFFFFFPYKEQIKERVWWYIVSSPRLYSFAEISAFFFSCGMGCGCWCWVYMDCTCCRFSVFCVRYLWPYYGTLIQISAHKCGRCEVGSMQCNVSQSARSWMPIELIDERIGKKLGAERIHGRRFHESEWTSHMMQRQNAEGDRSKLGITLTADFRT